MGENPAVPYWQNEQAFKDAVSAATEAAVGQYINKQESFEHRRPVWMLVIACLLGVIIGASISIPITLVLDSRTHHSQLENSRTNCKLITSLAGVDQTNYARQSQKTSEFQEKSKDRFGLSQQDFEHLLAQQQDEEHKRLQRIQSIAHFNCTTGVK